MAYRICTQAALLIVLVQAPAVVAEDWPMSGRDRTRNAVSPEKGPPRWWQVPQSQTRVPARNIKWQVRLGSQTKGDPIVANGLVWVGTNNNEPRDPGFRDKAPVLMCFREKDGAFLYQYVTAIPADDHFADFRFAGHTSSPLVENGRMWFTTVRGEVVCLDIAPLEKGQGLPRELWKLDMRKALGVFPSWAPMGYGRTCSIACQGDFIYVLTGNGVDADDRVPAALAPSLICLHKNTGKVIWSDNSPGKNILDGQYASPLVIEVNGRSQVIAPMGDGWVRSFDAITGDLLWKFDGNPKNIKRPRGWNNWFATPVFYDGRVYLGNGNSPARPHSTSPGWLYCLDPTRKGDISVEVEAAPGNARPNSNSGVVWRFGGLDDHKERRFSGTLASVAIHADLAIANDTNGYVNCLDAKTGQLYCKHDALDEFTTSPLIVDGKVMIASQGGELILLALHKEKKLLDRIDMLEMVSTSPVFANGVLFVATSTTLYAIAGNDKNPSSEQGQDWPQFGRDQTRNAVSPEKNPATWWQIETRDAKQQIRQPAKNILWSANLGSITYGDPVVVDGLVWVGTNNQAVDVKAKPEDASVLTCLDQRTGRILYRYVSPRLKNLMQDWPHSSMASSPLIEGKRLWFLTNRCEVVCLDIEPLHQGTGEPRQLWKVDMPKELGVIPYGTPMGLARKCSLAAYRDLVFVITGNGMDESHRNVPAPEAPSLVCFNKNTGKVVWTDNSPGKNIIEGQWASPLVIEVNGQAQVVAPQGDGWLRAFEAQTGKLIWKFDTNPKDAVWKPGGRGTRNNLLATPVYYDRRIYIGNGLHPEHQGGQAWLYCIDPTKTGDISPELDDGPGKGKANPNSGMVWRFGGRDATTKKLQFLRTVSNVAIDRGLMIAADIEGFVYCLDARTGQEYWRHEAAGQILGSPLIVDSKVYVPVNDGTVYVLALAKELKVLKEIDMPDRLWCSPIFAHGVLYIATGNRLFAIAGDAKKPAAKEVPDKKERPRAPDAIFVPTPHDVVDKMLEIAGVKKADLVADLGCGDGRIVVAAAKKYGCRAVGYDLDPQCVKLANELVGKEKVENLVRIEQKDIFTLDLRQVDVVALYLPPRLNAKLLPQLEKLKPGARIASHQFPIPGVRPERVVRYRSTEDGAEHTLYLWTVPLKREVDQ